MIDAHPRLNCPSETDFLFDHPVGAEGQLDLEQLQRSRIFRAHAGLYGDAPDKDLTLFEMIKRMSGPEGAIPVLMLHRNLGRALDHLPDVRVIHLVRDPRDVARSSIGMGWAGSVYYGIRHWLKTEVEWARVAARIPADRVITVKYEDLIEAHEDTLKAICAFADVPFDAAMLDFHEGTTYAKPDPGLIYQWKRKQTPYEIGLVEAQAGDLLTELGYSPSGHPPVVPGAVKRMGLSVQHRRSVWQHRIQRFGVRDSAIVYLARRLRMPSLGAAAQRRIDEKTKAYLK